MADRLNHSQSTLIEDCEFAVVDVETTGLFPQRNDRVVEVAVMRVDGSGNLVDEFVTLVNPKRDLGATHIHGITAKDVKHAPTFEEIAGDVVSRLAGAVFVAHNVQFDYKFIRTEVGRLGYNLPEPPLLCTMRLAKLIAPLIPGRKLEVCCSHFGIPHENAHSSYDDALATSKLLGEFLRIRKEQGAASLADLGLDQPLPEKDSWPKIPVAGTSHTRKGAAEMVAAGAPYINRLITNLPMSDGSQSELDGYLALLDNVLADRRLTADEADELLRLCADYGISRDQALDANYMYLRDLIRAALADGFISGTERKDLDEVRQLLLISRNSFQDLLSIAKQDMGEWGSKSQVVPHVKDDPTGKTVCFTGILNCTIEGALIPRATARKLAEGRGMVVRDSVTKDLDILVAADPDSLSGKAKKARDYDIKIVAEPVFWQMVGVKTD